MAPGTRLVDVEAIFHAVLARAEGERAAYLAEHTRDAPALRHAVERLLRADDSDNGFLAAPALGAGFVLPSADRLRDGAAAQRIGPYQLIRPLGSGGVGHVWLARRADGQFDKDVAIKLIKRGMDTDAILDRFRAERQVLARLEHPNIARLLDGGATDDGLPFLAMEYVDGAPIDTYCRTHALSLHARLALFQKVCAAVRYAHQNLVVHRDVKPGNILVTAAGEPKLLDFGIAKVLSADGAPGATLAAGEGRLLTPEYASPEQIAGRPITTASDVYSLGVVLYELLTDRSPYELSRSRRPDLGRVVLDDEPACPSARVLSAPESETHGPAGVGQPADAPPAQRAAALRGDLDTIAMKALRKDPAERYVSVEQLSDDIERYFARLPIRARPATWTYRGRRFVQRHAGGVIAATVAVLAVLGGLAFSTVSYFQADAARKRESTQRTLAEQRQAEAESAHARSVDEAAKVRATNEFLQTLLSTDDPALKLRANIELWELLEEAGRALRAGALADQPEVEAAVRTTIGRTYTDLRIPNQAEPHLRRALEVYTAMFGGDALVSVDTAAHLALCLCEQSKFDEGIPLHRRALALRRALDPGDEATLLRRLWRFSTALRDNDDLAEAEAVAREALDISLRIHGPRQPLTAESRFRLGLILSRERKLDEAETQQREALALQRELLGPAHPACGESLLRLGQTLDRRRQPADAEALIREAVRILRESLGENHPNTLRAVSNLANFLFQRGTYGEAESLYEDLIARYTEYYGYNTGYVANVLLRQSRVRVRLDDLPGAEALVRESVRLFRAAFGDDHWEVVKAQLDLADVLVARGSFDEVESLITAAAGQVACASAAPRDAERIVATRVLRLYEAWLAVEPDAERNAKAELWRARVRDGGAKSDERATDGPP